MTIRQAMEQLDNLINQEYDRDILIGWLAELDGMAIREIFDGYCGSPVPEGWQPYDYTTELDTQLLIPEPYTAVYLDFLRLKLDTWNREKNYTYSLKAFNASYKAFGDFWRRTHRRCQPRMKL